MTTSTSLGAPGNSSPGEDKWIKDEDAIDDTGCGVPLSHVDACAFCLTGAFGRAILVREGRLDEGEGCARTRGPD